MLHIAMNQTQIAFLNEVGHWQIKSHLHQIGLFRLHALLKKKKCGHKINRNA